MAIASRLQGIAESDTIVVSERVHRLAGSRFDYLDKGARTLKGIARPIRVWRVTGLRRVESRFEAMHGAPLTAFHRPGSRGPTLCTSCWRKVVAGQGQVITIGGEAGIGKSRLARIIIDETRDDPSVWVTELQCSPFHTLSALYPIADQLRQRLFSATTRRATTLRAGPRSSPTCAPRRCRSRRRCLCSPICSPSTRRPASPISPMTPERARLMMRHFLVSLMIDQARAGPGILLARGSALGGPLDARPHRLLHRAR